MKHRDQISQFKQEHWDGLEKLDLATKSILDAIVERQDVFQAAHEAQLMLTKTLHENTIRNIDNTRQEIIQVIRVIFLFSLSKLILILSSTNSRIFRNRSGG